eukprot:4567148-Heterocapsa_arctica.AAC.3
MGELAPCLYEIVLRTYDHGRFPAWLKNRSLERVWCPSDNSEWHSLRACRDFTTRHHTMKLFLDGIRGSAASRSSAIREKAPHTCRGRLEAVPARVRGDTGDDNQCEALGVGAGHPGPEACGGDQLGSDCGKFHIKWTWTTPAEGDRGFAWCSECIGEGQDPAPPPPVKPRQPKRRRITHKGPVQESHPEG